MPRSASPPGPNRTRLIAAVVAVVAVVVGVLAWTRGPSQAAPTTDQTRLGPVILVPGYGGGTGALDTLAARLQATGRSTTVLQLAGDGTGDLMVQARLLKAAADAALAAGAPSVDVVGYSAGGVVARLWAAELGGASRARRIVLLGSPNHGTDIAALGVAFAGSLCPAACRQLAPNSDLLAALNALPEAPAGPQWVSIWSAQDQVVTPADSARLDGALDIVVQDVCSGESVDHASLPTDPVMQALVVRAVATAVMTAPTAADCASLHR